MKNNHIFQFIGMNSRNCLLLLFTSICMLSLFSSCELETSHNGDLDGMWHLIRVDTLENGHYADLQNEKIYWSFQRKLLQLDDKSGRNTSILFYFDRQASNMKVYNAYIYDRNKGDEKLNDPMFLHPYGLSKLEENLNIEHLSGGKLLLSTAKLRLRFVKF